jgi:hypothetical protein
MLTRCSHITEAKTEILEGPDIYVDRLSTLMLTCRLDFGPKTPEYVIWRKDDKVITT